jgi:hypothetical protein
MEPDAPVIPMAILRMYYLFKSVSFVMAKINSEINH